MDDFVLSNLQESKNEWCSRLVSIFSPLVIEGIRSIFNESWKMCVENNEVDKYLMTFQNLLSRIPKWNAIIVEEERKRIIERSGCNYLEDLITCVHIIQLKVLTCIRVGNKQKKIDISIPNLDNFIHKVYINTARKLYMNVYLFEKNINPLQVQKNNRELEVIIQESILTAIRESIPTEAIIRAYMEESVEQEEEVIIEKLDDPVLEKGEGGNGGNVENEEVSQDKQTDSYNEELPSMVPSIQNIDNEPVITRLSFNDYDSIMDTKNQVDTINAPKTIERLEEISTSRAIQRKLEEESESDDDNDRITIDTEPMDLTGFELLDGDTNKISSDIPLFDFEELP
jgi:hypothetical protein